MNGTEDPRPMRPGPEVPERRPDSAALKTIGILNIIFALICGCMDTTVWVPASALTDSASLGTREEFIPHYMREVKAQREKSLAGVESEQERQSLEETYARFEDEEVAGVAYDSLAAISHSESLAKTARFGLFAVLLQAGLLVSGILLLARVRVGRMLAILACLGLIVLNILLPAAMADTTDHFADRFLTGVAEVRPDVVQDLTPESKDELVTIVRTANEVLPIVYYGFGGLAALYPVIALLILLLSTGLKRALGIGLEPRVDW